MYFSVDVETDGPVPGPFSMVSVGACVAGTFDGGAYQERDPRQDTFYSEMSPISDQYQPEALAISGISREQQLACPTTPRQAMTGLATWVRQASRGHRAVFAAYPAVFDFAFVHYYLVMYGGDEPDLAHDPFGFSSALDMKTLYSAKARVPIGRSTKRHMPQHLLGTAPHTHNALDDAVEQAQMLGNLMRWER